MPTFSLHGTDVFYLEEGAGTPVICLHAGAGSSLQWRLLMRGLKASHRLLAPDLMGEGRTGIPAQVGAPTLEYDLDIVSHLLEMLPEPAHLVGHSYGGVIALHSAMRDPSRVRSVTIYEPVTLYLLDTAPAAYLEEVLKLREEVVGRLERQDVAGATAHFIDYWNGRGAYAMLPEMLQSGMRRSIHKIGGGWDVLTTYPEQLLLKHLSMPLLALHGETSPEPARWVAARWKELLPHARLQMIRGAGHMAPVTHPGPFNAAVRDFLESLG
jgi:pimeloyl-ACP methyl ester carboxylesterase